MNLDCQILNPLQRDGVSQENRLIRALHPSYVKIDERGIADLLLYAKKYAKCIRFYSLDNQPVGDWSNFIEADISTLVAIISRFDIKSHKKQFEAIGDANWETLLAPIVGLIEAVYNWHSRSIKGLKLYVALEKLIQTHLNGILQRLKAYELRINAIQPGFITLDTAFLGTIPDLFSSIIADDSIFSNDDLTHPADLEAVIFKIKRAYQQTYQAVFALIEQAPNFLEETLEQYPEHQPHFALFLTFLQLFSIAQQHLNGITRRHLNFYYQEVLQVKAKTEQPDEVHLVFQLAKNFQTDLIEQDVLFKAGKDAANVNVFFGANKELVVNKTQLYEDGLKTVFIDKVPIANSNLSANANLIEPAYGIHNIYAAPIANSADGLGADLEDKEGKWETLGGTTMPYAKVGFAISSPLFLLQEGKRTITLIFEAKNTFNWDYGTGSDIGNTIAHELRHNIQVSYSSEEEWVDTVISKVTIEDGIDNNLMLTFIISINTGQAPFVPFSKEKLQPEFSTEYPTLRFIFDNDGLSADYLCFGVEWLENEAEATTKIPTIIQQLILKFLNEPETEEDWEEIAGLEREDEADDPVLDNPFTGTAPDNFETGYDIGETVARRIIRHRNGTLDDEFTDISQLIHIPGLGVDKLNDLFYTFCVQDISEDNISTIKEKALPYQEEQPYEFNAIVIYEGKYYRAILASENQEPSADSAFWQQLHFSYPYQYFQNIAIEQLTINVNVEGMTNLILENDVGVLNPAKPFLPFGPLPKKGSKFYIGSYEVFKKQLKSLKVSWEWADLPETDFNTHYQHYREGLETSATTDDGNLPVLNNEYFQAKIEVLHNGIWKNANENPAVTDSLKFKLRPETIPPTFNPLDACEVEMETLSPLNISLFNNSTSNIDIPTDKMFRLCFRNYENNEKQDNFNQLNPSLRRGFLRLNLQNDFFHKQYPKWITRAALFSAVPNLVPNEPYTPTISSFKLDYVAEEAINFQNFAFPDRVEQFFHITPFGWQEFYPNDLKIKKEEAIVSEKLVPEFLVTTIDEEGQSSQTDAEGTLYIGLKDLQPEQNVSILIQVAEGSADPDQSKQPVVWSYLSNNEWIDFEKTQVLEDSTNGLLTSGIVTLVMPKRMTQTNTQLPAEVYWIKASVAQTTEAISQAVAILPQAVKASFRKEKNNDLNRLATALPAEIISKLKERRASVKKISQPFASFDGKLAEQIEAPEGITGKAIYKKAHNEYYIRISERLRHKQRAVCIFDYERLVLQQFPDVYKAKCLNHTQHGKSEYAPGHVKLIVIPDLRNKNAVDPLQPKVSLNQLEAIKSFLQPLKSDFVNLEVRNATFEGVQVECKIQLLPGKDKGFHTQKLQRDILRFLSPWLFDEGADLQLGGSVHGSVIINFIEKTDYVDFVTDFKLYQHVAGEIRAVEEAVASTSSSVLVSVPAAEHNIDPDINIQC